ncbi:hypothetical protein B0H14DRAFT_2972255 [Mycena olivaceomarginata]|nr:hypothetical protein B0H14DRAFT_2972255 [Mycena olivaceomarginata]
MTGVVLFAHVHLVLPCPLLGSRNPLIQYIVLFCSTGKRMAAGVGKGNNIRHPRSLADSSTILESLRKSRMRLLGAQTHRMRLFIFFASGGQRLLFNTPSDALEPKNIVPRL